MSQIVPFARGYGNTYTSPFLPVPYVSQEVKPYSPPPESGGLKEWWREMRGEPSPMRAPETPVQSAVLGLRLNGESAAIGALLALIDTDLGGLDLGGRLPLDWAGAAAFYMLSIRESGKPESLAADYRAMGQSCMTVATYRMIHRWREAAKGIPRNTSSGDPVLAAGKSSAF